MSELQSEMALLAREVSDARAEVEEHAQMVARARGAERRADGGGDEVANAQGGGGSGGGGGGGSEALASEGEMKEEEGGAPAAESARSAASPLGAATGTRASETATSAAGASAPAAASEGGSRADAAQAGQGGENGADGDDSGDGGDGDDRFQPVMRPFVSDAAAACAALEAQFNAARNELADLVAAYGYPRDKPFGELVLLIAAFARALQRAEQENSAAARASRKQAQQTPAPRCAGARAAADRGPATAPTVAPAHGRGGLGEPPVREPPPTASPARPPVPHSRTAGDASAAAAPAGGAGGDQGAPVDDGLLPLGGGLTGGLPGQSQAKPTSGRSSLVPSMEGIRKKLLFR